MAVVGQEAEGGVRQGSDPAQEGETPQSLGTRALWKKGECLLHSETPTDLFKYLFVTLESVFWTDVCGTSTSSITSISQ